MINARWRARALFIYFLCIARDQLSFWLKDDPCFVYPTLDIDVLVDFFFIVRALAHEEMCMWGGACAQGGEGKKASFSC